MKRFIFLLLIIIVLGGVWYAYKLYTGKVPSLTEVKTDATVSASNLITAFEKDSAAANKQYLGKIVEVTGSVKAVDAAESSLTLGAEGSPSSVRCSIDSAFVKNLSTINAGSIVTVKGACTGFMPDEMGLGLGSDVVLNRCIIQTK